MLRKGEIEDPGNARLAEDDPERVYLGPGYRRRGNNYVFGGPVAPCVPSQPSTAEGEARRSLSRLEIELKQQEEKLDSLYEPLRVYAGKIIQDARYGRPIVRSGTFHSLFTDIEEQKFIVSQLKAAMGEEKSEG